MSFGTCATSNAPITLPAGTRNKPEKQHRGGNRYRDVRYRAWHVIVELDGRAAHPLTEKFRDMKRDNGATVAGDSGAAVRLAGRCG